MSWFSRNSFDPATDLPDLMGKRVIVTGGSGGIGYATVQHLARHGAKVYLAARNKEKASDAVSRLHSEGLGPGNGAVMWLDLDLSDPRKALDSARSYVSKEDRLDILINNAAMPRGPHSKTHDGVQDIMMVNHISPFVFTMALLPLMTKTAQFPGSDVRIVNVSSDGMSILRRGIRFRNLDDFNDEHKGELAPGLARYARSKLANALFTTELQRHLDASGIPIITISLNPGLVRTDGVQNDAASQPPIISHIFSLLVRTLWTLPSRGAYTSVFAAASPVVREQPDLYGGAYLQPPGRLSSAPHAAVRDPELARELWDATERFLKDIGVHIPPH